MTIDSIDVSRCENPC